MQLGSTFFTKFDVAIKRSVPLTSSKPKFKNVYTNKDVIRLSKKKRSLWNEYCSTLSTLDYNRFAKVRNDLHSLTRRLKSDYEETLFQTSKQTRKYFGNMSILK